MTTIHTRRFASASELDSALVERLQKALEGNVTPTPGTTHIAHTGAAVGTSAASDTGLAARASTADGANASASVGPGTSTTVRAGTDVGTGTAVMLSGGHTPLPSYRELGRRKLHPAPGLRVLFSDDRYVPATADASNYFQSRPLLDTLALPESSVLRIQTERPLEQAAADYDEKLRQLIRTGVRIDLGLLGLGADGHTASLFSAANLEQARGRLAIAVQRPDGLSGVSVTPELLSHVAEVLFLVAGPDKHQIVEAFLKSDSDLIARRAVEGCASVELWIAP